MGRKFPAGDLRRTQPITSKAEVRGGEGRRGRKRGGGRGSAADEGKIDEEEEEAEERQGVDDHSFGSAAVLTSDWLRCAL